MQPPHRATRPPYGGDPPGPPVAGPGFPARASRWPGREQLAQAVVTGTATTLWYALPDFVSSPAARFWIKTGLATAVIGWSAGSSRPLLSGAATPSSDLPAGDAPSPGPSLPTDRNRVGWRGVVGLVVLVCAVASGLVASVVVTVAADRAVHRLGEWAARRGALHPHSRNAVVLGVAAALSDLWARPEDRRRRRPPLSSRRSR